MHSQNSWCELCLINGWHEQRDPPFRCACETPPHCPRLPSSPRSALIRVSSRTRGEHTLMQYNTTRCSAMQRGNAELTWVKIAWKMACERELSSFIIVDAATAVSMTNDARSWGFRVQC